LRVWIENGQISGKPILTIFGFGEVFFRKKTFRPKFFPAFTFDSKVDAGKNLLTSKVFDVN
jgi:hypothetical protein